VRHLWLLAWLPVSACSDKSVESAARAVPGDSSPGQTMVRGKELIPAEWTVSEDTGETGDVTTASLQLPMAKDIRGLLDSERPRLVLRCVEGKVEASIDTESADSVEGGQTVPIQLDSAPACE
jgi:hypothetical protein